MDKNAKIARVSVLRRKQAKHVACLEGQGKHAAALAAIELELCPLLTELLCEHGPANDVDGDVIAAASEPKDGGNPR